MADLLHKDRERVYSPIVRPELSAVILRTVAALAAFAHPSH